MDQTIKGKVVVTCRDDKKALTSKAELLVRAIHYNLGLCAELAGRLEEAPGLYTKADRLTALPVKEIGEALNRVRISQDRERKLKKRLRKGNV